MEKLIYSKFSNERDSRYAIETSIVIDEAQKQWVVKRPMSADGKQHFENIKQAYHSLSQMFPEQKMKIQPYIEADGEIRFPYVEGEDMEKILHRTFEKEGYENMLAVIREYFAMIREYSSDCTYSKTEEFVKMFGDYDFPEGTKCGKANNLDYGFANVIVSGQEKTLIDYEWTVDFPVPIDFLLYRALHYYVYTSPNSIEMVDKGIFDSLGFRQDDITKYVAMEKHFQKYISSGMTTLGELHETMGAATYNINEMEQCYKKEKEPFMQVYFDYGDGFIHENSYYTTPKIDEEGVETLQIENIPENALRVRIDPRKESCVMKVISFQNEHKDDMISEMDCNGTSCGEHVYVFNVPDPWFVVAHKDYHELTLQISLKSECYVSELCRMKEENENLQRRAEEAERQYNDVLNSTSWKITEPLRKIGNRGHK